MCQRPKRAFFISTLTPITDISCFRDVCQRPKRAFFISTDQKFTRSLKTSLCVNALNGLSSFLQIKEATAITHAGVCQRPKRAFFISTVPSETPHKYWLPSLIFAGICLKILKQKDFRLFFGMFIVCSYF